MFEKLDLYFAKPQIEKKRPARNLEEKRNLAQTFGVIFLSTALMILIPKFFGGTNEAYSLFVISLISLFAEITTLMYVTAIALSSNIKSKEFVRTLSSVSLLYIAFASTVTIIKILLIIVL